MTDPRADSDDTGAGRDSAATSGAPRWVKAFGIVIVLLVLLAVVVMVFGGGEHGPGRHTSSGDAGSQAPFSAIAVGLSLSGADDGGHTLAERA